MAWVVLVVTTPVLLPHFLPSSRALIPSVITALVQANCSQLQLLAEVHIWMLPARCKCRCLDRNSHICLHPFRHSSCLYVLNFCGSLNKQPKTFRRCGLPARSLIVTQLCISLHSTLPRQSALKLFSVLVYGWLCENGLCHMLWRIGFNVEASASLLFMSVSSCVGVLARNEHDVAHSGTSLLM